MKKTYDFVFGLGPACSCSQTLRKAKLQLLSFPFDWTGYTRNMILYPGDMPKKIDDICAGMEHWFEREDISYVFRKIDGQNIPYNKRTTGIFPHDFHSLEELDRNFDKVQTKYKRRIARLLELIRTSKDVLIVRLDAPPGEPPTPDEDCRYARRKMAATFAGTNFDIVHFRCEKGRSFEDRTDREIEPGFREIAFDYHDYAPGKPFYEVRLDLAAKALCQHYAVRDYRTSEERSRGRWQALRKLLHLK